MVNAQCECGERERVEGKAILRRSILGVTTHSIPKKGCYGNAILKLEASSTGQNPSGELMQAGPLYIASPPKAGWPPWAITPDYTCTSMTEYPPSAPPQGTPRRGKGPFTPLARSQAGSSLARSQASNSLARSQVRGPPPPRGGRPLSSLAPSQRHSSISSLP